MKIWCTNFEVPSFIFWVEVLKFHFSTFENMVHLQPIGYAYILLYSYYLFFTKYTRVFDTLSLLDVCYELICFS